MLLMAQIHLRFDTSNNKIILDDGNVGIGTQNPLSKLDVNGTIKSTEFTDGTAILTGGELSRVVRILTNEITRMDEEVGLNINFNSNSAESFITLRPGLPVALDVTDGTNTYLRFDTSNNKIILDTGNVNIGNTSSASILSVSSLDKATLSLESAEEFDSSTNPGYNKTISQIHFKSLDTSINNLQYTQMIVPYLVYVQVYKQSLRVKMVHLLE